MKKMILTVFVVMAMMVFAGCDTPAEVGKETATDNTPKVEVSEPVVEEVSSLPFADVEKDIMSAAKEYKLFRFTEPEGTCMEMDFPENLIYKSTNRIMTEDESYFDQMTMVDFTGLIRFKEVPLTNDVVAHCTIKTTSGINMANLVCKTGEGEAETEVCTGTFKVVAEK